MTISPPSNVKGFQSETSRALVSGVDWVTVALQVEWQTGRLFYLLRTLKEIAKTTGDEEPARLTLGSDAADWLFMVKPHGKDGYEWILTSREMTMKIGNWKRPKQRPSVMADIRSETLWLHGPDAAVTRLLNLIQVMGGRTLAVKASRVDVCVDLLIRASDWTEKLRSNFVTRARDISPHFHAGKLTGFSIGRGLVSARLYDKALEIRTKSGKTWMYDHWKLTEVPQGFIVVRVEFQVRRERLKELGCNTWQELRDNLSELWMYCATKWLRLVEDASVHHTQQTLLPWWELVSAGFEGEQTGNALVREKVYSFELRRYASQVIGGLCSISALLAGDEPILTEPPVKKRVYCQTALDVALSSVEITDAEFSQRIIQKQPRYNRSKPGFIVNE